MKQCQIPGCSYPHLAHGMCSKHYGRWYKYGDPLTVYRPRASNGEPWRFLEKVLLYQGDECIQWPFCRGYAKVGYNGATIYVPRLICERLYGPPPTSYHQAAHRCGNGKLGCITPGHLRWATQTENESDKLLPRKRLRLELVP